MIEIQRMDCTRSIVSSINLTMLTHLTVSLAVHLLCVRPGDCLEYMNDVFLSNLEQSMIGAGYPLVRPKDPGESPQWIDEGNVAEELKTFRERGE